MGEKGAVEFKAALCDCFFVSHSFVFMIVRFLLPLSKLSKDGGSRGWTMRLGDIRVGFLERYDAFIRQRQSFLYSSSFLLEGRYGGIGHTIQEPFGVFQGSSRKVCLAPARFRCDARLNLDAFNGTPMTQTSRLP
jgi:hypothetical protein